MKKPHMPEIRRVLRENPDGLTAHHIHALLPEISKVTVIKSSLAKMPDAYVDRWVKGKRGQYEAVWAVVVPPPNCPDPRDRFYQTRWVTPQRISNKDGNLILTRFVNSDGTYMDAT